MSDKSADEPKSSSEDAAARAAAARMTGSSSAMTATPSVWPKGTARTATLTRLAAKAWSQAAGAVSSGIFAAAVTAPTATG